MNNNWYKKEKPLLGLTGLGGGVDGLAVVGAATKTYVDNVFNTYAYHGNGTARSISNGVDLAGKGGLVWTKVRNNGYSHAWMDSARGVSKYLRCERDNGEDTYSGNGVTSFNSDGYSLGNDQSSGLLNYSSSEDYVSWSFCKAPGFFDVVTYTGNGTADRSIAHNLGSLPGMIIIKRTDGTGEWYTANLRADGAQYNFCMLNENSAKFSNDLIANVADASNIIVDGTSNGGTGSFANLSGGAHTINTTGETYVAYLFAHNDGDGTFGESGDKDIIKCSSYTGNGSSSGPTITLGWEPQWVLIKNTSASADWVLFDSIRGIVTGDQDKFLFPNEVTDETEADRLTLTSTGFKIPSSGYRVNDSGNVYSYIAIRRPDGYVGKPAEVGTDVFALSTGNNTTTGIPQFTSNFPVDFGFVRQPATTSSTDVSTRLTQGKYLTTQTNAAEGTWAPFAFDSNTGWIANQYDNTWMSWAWKRGQGFDVVAYTGTGVAHSISHSLSQTPEMMWCKNRSRVQSWHCYHNGLNGGTTPENWFLKLNDSQAEGEQTSVWNDTAPTSTVFYVGTDTAVNYNGDEHLMLLFSSVTGISKCGYYDGSNSEQTITTGFQPRCVIIKCATAAEGWLVLDTTRGWGAGDDKAIFLNTTDAQGTDPYGAPTSTGFTVVGNWNVINQSGKKYIYYAHA